MNVSESNTMFSKIKIGNRNIVLKDLLLQLPSVYQYREILNAETVILPNISYKFLLNNPNIIRNKKYVIINGVFNNHKIEVIHSLKLYKFFYYQEVLIFCGKIDNGKCFYPEILHIFKDSKEIIPEYRDLPSTTYKHTSNYIQYLPLGLQELFRKIHVPNSMEEIQESINILGKLELMSFKKLIEKNKTIREPYKIFDLNSSFTLTIDQEKVMKEIYHDLQEPYQSIRIVHGDVGSGKTIIALLSSMQVLQNNKKVIIMAPTGVLAEQLFTFFSAQLFNYKVILVTSLNKKKKDFNINGDVLIGTHALLYQKDIENVGLLIIDEQHRFGVNQRNVLANDTHPDILMLTATPIPRTFQMLLKGYISVSQLRDTPFENRRDTIILKEDKIQEIIIKAQSIAKNELVLWVCHTIEKSKERYEYFQQHVDAFLLHSKVIDKNDILRIFSNNVKGILVSTTVIEVGIDIDVSYIFIEDADKFGLAQLHQLRGRVGRKGKNGYCILIGQNMSKLKMIKQSDDGFKISENDYKRRGGGMIAGTVQSGFDQFRYLKKLHNYRFEDLVDIESFNEQEEQLVQSLLTTEIMKLLLEFDDIAI